MKNHSIVCANHYVYMYDGTPIPYMGVGLPLYMCFVFPLWGGF